MKRKCPFYPNGKLHFTLKVAGEGLLTLMNSREGPIGTWAFTIGGHLEEECPLSIPKIMQFSFLPPWADRKKLA